MFLSWKLQSIGQFKGITLWFLANSFKVNKEAKLQEFYLKYCQTNALGEQVGAFQCLIGSINVAVDQDVPILMYKRDSLTISALACHAADPGSNPAQGDDFFN